MRTGQIDMIHRVGGGTTIGKVEVVKALLGTNPDIQVGTCFQRALQVSGLNIRKPPFDDIRCANCSTRPATRAARTGSASRSPTTSAVEIAAGYWKEIGVEVEITLHDTGRWVPRRVDGLYDMTTGDQA